MADASQAPLNNNLIRTLTDKLYEKRKGAALEVEKLVREQVAAKNWTAVEKILDALADLARSQNPHNRKGGLIGLAAAGIALGKASENYTHQLILPVLDCFNDPDSRVRYFACEALFNISKVAREAVLIHFQDLFDVLSRLAADTDQNVKNGGELLDRLLKDIVTSKKDFDVSMFMVLLRERIHTKNSSVRRFLVSWLNTLYTVPDINLLPFLPEVLDGLLQILSDPSHSIRELCESVLGQFLKSIKQHPDQVSLKDMVNVLIVHAQASDNLVQYISLIWLKEFLSMNGVQLLPYTSGYMTSILPCLAYTEDHQRDIHDVAKAVNVMLMRLVKDDTPSIDTLLDIPSVVEVLKTHLNHDAVQTRVAVLKWIHHLHNKMPTKVFPHMEDLFPVLLKMLSDASDEVVLLDLEVLSDICQGSVGVGSVKLDLKGMDIPPPAKDALQGTSPYFVKFAVSLLDMFRQDPSLLNERGSFIIRQLCLLLKPEEILRTLAILLCHESELSFASQMVQTLSGILLTSTELFQLRNQLKSLDDKPIRDLFICLYRCWCHQPVSVVALCLLSQNYAHASQLICLFSDLEITVDFLIEIDKFIQLMESPIFAYMRLHLLDPKHQSHLASVLYGLLMLLPQTEAFHTLHRRLQCLPSVPAAPLDNKKEKPLKRDSDLPFEELMAHFRQIQGKHRHYRRLKHRELLSSQNA